MMFFLLIELMRTVQVLPTYIHQEDIKTKQIKYKNEGKISYEKGRKYTREYPMILNTPSQAGAYKSYAPSVLQMY